MVGRQPLKKQLLRSRMVIYSDSVPHFNHSNLIAMLRHEIRCLRPLKATAKYQRLVTGCNSSKQDFTVRNVAGFP